MLDGVGVIGAWTIHELVEVAGMARLGLLVYAIGHSDQRGVGQSTPILLVLFAPLRGGALILVLALGLALVLASIEDYSDHLLTGASRRWFGASGNQTCGSGTRRSSRSECADDVHVDDIRKGVAPLLEPTDVIPYGLVGLLLAALEVPGVSRVDICP